MKRTGIFYREICSKEAHPVAEGIEQGFKILEKEGLFAEPNVFLFESVPVAHQLILKVHSPDMLNRVRQTSYYEVSLYTAGGVVQASEKVLEEELDSGLALGGVGGAPRR